MKKLIILFVVLFVCIIYAQDARTRAYIKVMTDSTRVAIRDTTLELYEDSIAIIRTEIDTDDNTVKSLIRDTATVVVVDSAPIFRAEMTDSAEDVWVDSSVILRAEMTDSANDVWNDSAVVIIREDGTNALTGNWAAGDFDITGLEKVEADTLDATITMTGGFVLVDSIRTNASPWKYCKHISAHVLSAGGSGASQVSPSATSMGGYNLDDATEYLYFNACIRNNWDSISDPTVCFVWECDVDNSAGGENDTVELDLLVYLKGKLETTQKTQSLSIRTEVGQAAQYKMFKSTIPIDYDAVDHEVEGGDILSMRLSFDADNSDIADIIMVFIKFSYLTNVPQIKNY